MKQKKMSHQITAEEKEGNGEIKPQSQSLGSVCYRFSSMFLAHDVDREIRNEIHCVCNFENCIFFGGEGKCILYTEIKKILTLLNVGGYYGVKIQL